MKRHPITRCWLAPGYSFQVRDDSGALWPPGFVAQCVTSKNEAANAGRSSKQTDRLEDPETRKRLELTIKR